MVDYLVSVYGLHKIREILVNLGRGLTIQDAVSQAFADYGLDYSTVICRSTGTRPEGIDSAAGFDFALTDDGLSGIKDKKGRKR